MSIDTKTAAHVARLARIRVEEADLEALAQEFNAILGFIEQLEEVDVSDVEPMVSVTPMRLARRVPMASLMGTNPPRCWPMRPKNVKASLPCRRWWNNERSQRS